MKDVNVAVVGAGIGGLMSALALARKGIAVTVFERDAPPPANVAPADSMEWRRKGVPQSLHPHFLMGRLRLLLEARYPDLVEALLEAGVGENALTDYVHPRFRARYREGPGDARLRSLNSRRTTFEMIVREHVESLPDVTVRDGTRAVALLASDTGSVPLRVSGVAVESSAGREEFPADAVIDASGRFSKFSPQLESLGVSMRIDERDSGLVYLTRHYRLNEECDFPQASGLPGAVFADFILGALPADNRTFTVTFQVYSKDKAIVRALRDADHFQAMCMAVETVRPWVEPARSSPTSSVFGFGQMDSFWRQTVVDGEPQVLGLYFVGDSCVRSNPKFGRGCTWSTVAAHLLADLLAADLPAEERIRRYETGLETEFRRDWLTMRQIDAATETGFEIASGRRRATPIERLSMKLTALVNEATVSEPEFFRELWTGYHGLQGMSDWMRKPRVWPRLARAWLASGRYERQQILRRGRPARGELADLASSRPLVPKGPLLGEVPAPGARTEGSTDIPAHL